MSRLHRRPVEDRGAVMVMVAIALPVLLGATALAVDLGFQRVHRQEMQKVADVVSLDLARQIGTLGPTRGQILTADLNADAIPDWDQALLDSADRNNHLLASATSRCPASGVSIAQNCLTATVGVWDESTATFTACRDHPTWAAIPSQCLANAVRVIAGGPVDRLIRPGQSSTRRVAVANMRPEATLNLGSKVLSLASGDSAVLDPFVGTLLGSNVNFDAITYQGLAVADVTIQDLVDASTTFGSYTDLLEAELTAAEIRALAVTALTNNGNPTAAAALEAIFLTVDPSTTVEFGEIFGTRFGGPPAAASTAINAFDLMISSVQIANSESAVSACASLPTNGVVIGSLAALTAGICTSIVEPPVQVTGPANHPSTSPPIFRTAQARSTVRLSANLNLPVSVLGLVGARIAGALQVPLTVEGGRAEGRLQHISCPAHTTNTLVTPRLLSGFAGDPSNALALTVRARVLGIEVPVANVSVRIEEKDISPVHGNQTAVDNQLEGEVRQVPPVALDLGVQPLDADDLDIGVQALVLNLGGLTESVIAAALLPVLNTMLNTVRDISLPTLDALGLGLGGSDLRLIDVDCEGLRLTE